MTTDELAYLTVTELASRIRKGELSPVEITEACLSRIEAHDDKLNAFITVTANEAREAAKRAEKEIRGGRDRGTFHGIPIALKDLIEVEGVRMTAGSKILESHVAPRTATVARRLEEAGAVAIMPLGAPIGSGLGIQNRVTIRLIVEGANVPVLVDAGVGTASDAAVGMELGCDGILMNTAIAEAKDPIRMARAMKLAVQAGRDAYLSGRMATRKYADPSSPLAGLI